MTTNFLRLLGLTAACVTTSVATAATPIMFERNDGFKIGNEDYWLKVGGVLKLDQRIYKGDKREDVHTGAQIRDFGLNFDGNIAEDLSYTLGFSFKSKTSEVKIEDAYLTYSGWGDNFNISIGQVNPGFSLENTASSKWNPFLERSLATTAFGSSPGLGVSLNKWNDNFSFTMSVTQPLADDTVKKPLQTPTGTDPNNNNGDLARSDRWQTTARLTWAPIKDDAKILQVGLSGHIQDDSRAAVRYKTLPETRARNAVEFLNTGYMESNRRATSDFEIMGQYNSFTAEIEYQQAFVNRVNSATENADKLSFHGYHMTMAYILTGEVRPHKSSCGTFGQIKPNSNKGAWEIAARHSYLNMNDKDVNGGQAHNTGLGLSWYPNKNIRIASEYIFSKQKKLTDVRNLHSVGLRLQLVF